MAAAIITPVCRIGSVASATRWDGDGHVVLAVKPRAAPAGEGIAGFGRILEGESPCLDGVGVGIALRSASGQIIGDRVLIDLPLCPVFLIAHFCTADRRNRRAGQTLVIIPALEGVPGARHICRECCAHAVGIACDILPVCDRAAVRIQGYGVGWGCPLHRQGRHISRNTAAGFVGIAIAVKPHKVAACISVRAGQTLGCRRSKCAAVFHDDLNILGAITQRAAAKVKGNGFQSVRVQCVRVQDFKDGAETDVRVGVRSKFVEPEAGRKVPANRTVRRAARRNILSPRKHLIPVLDISAVLIQHRVPFIICGRTASGIVGTCIVTSHRRCAQGIVHAAAGIIFAENQTFVIQATPANRMRYGIVRHKQAVGVFVLLCILLGGHHRRRELVGFYCSRIGKGNIVQRRIRQRNCAVFVPGVHRAGNTHCR